MKDKDTVIILCTGNICRSPMGEGLLKHAIEGLPTDSPLKKLKVISAGTFGEDGLPASPNSVTALQKVGVDISKHVAKTLTPAMLERAFALVAMTQSHLDTVKYRFPNSMPERAVTLLSLDPKAKNRDVMDPYGYGIRTYLEVRDEIAAAIPHLVKYLEQEMQ